MRRRKWAALALTTTAMVAGPPTAAETFQLVRAGECPGEEILTVAGATPGGAIELYAGTEEGAGEVPSGPCAGVELDLLDPMWIASAPADAEGGLSVTLTVDDPACGRLLQAVDAETCAAGNLERIVSGHPSPVPRSGQDESFGAGDDGDLRRGLAWPDPRFTADGDGTVTDELTGLVWLQDGDCLADRNWSQALDAAAGLADGACGLTDGSQPGDWRLPSVLELQSLIDYGEYLPALPDGHPFVDLQSAHYWTSSTYAFPTFVAWYVNLGNGLVSGNDKGIVRYFVLPVRGGR